MLPLWEGFAYKPHQITAIEWMLNCEKDLGGLLCDEMGLGKTMEVLGTIKNSKKKNSLLLCDEMGLGKTMEVLGLMKNTPKMRQTLLLCPKAVLSQWRDAAIKSNLTVLECNKGRWTLLSFRPGQPFLHLANYEKLSTPIFAGTWDRIVLDEAHRVRSKRSQAYIAIDKLSRKTLWAVTATPIVNSMKDIENLLSLVGYKQPSISDLVSEVCLHRSMDEMRPFLDLPSPPVITKEVLDFESEEEAEFYRGVQGKLTRSWKATVHDNVFVRLALIMRARQLSLHPQVYINARKKGLYARDDWTGSSTKFTALKKKLETSAPARWIVFCQFRDEMDLLKTMLEGMVDKVWLYHGGTADKDAVIADTFGPIVGHQVLLLQLQSGGVGLNLQHFSQIVFMSPWWTAALMDQAIGRAVRIGQTQLVEVTLFVLKEEETMNVDAMMLEKVEAKRGLLQEVLAVASRG